MWTCVSSNLMKHKTFFEIGKYEKMRKYDLVIRKSEKKVEQNAAICENILL